MDIIWSEEFIGPVQGMGLNSTEEESISSWPSLKTPGQNSPMINLALNGALSVGYQKHGVRMKI